MQSFHYYYCLCNTSSCFKPRRKTQYTIWWSTVWPHASGILQFMYIIHGHTNKWLLFCYTFTAKNNSVDITHKFGDIATRILMFMRFLFRRKKNILTLKLDHCPPNYWSFLIIGSKEEPCTNDQLIPQTWYHSISSCGDVSKNFIHNVQVQMII